MRRQRPITLLVVFLFLLSAPVFFTPVDAGPIDTFALSPIPYWDDDSSFVDLTWDTTDQTVTVEEDEAAIALENASVYYNDGTDVSDISFHSKSAAVGAGEYGLTTVGGNIETWIDLDSTSDEYVIYQIDFTDIDNTAGNLNVSMRWKIEHVDNEFYCKLYYDDASYDDIVPVSGEEVVWTITEMDADAGKVLDFIYIYTNDLPNTANSGNYSTYIDWIYIYDTTWTVPDAELDLGVPINQQTTQSIDMMINTTSLNSDVKLELLENVTSSGMYCNFNSTHIYFPTDGFLGVDYVEATIFRLTMSLSEETHYARITISDEDLVIYDYFDFNYARSANDILRFTDAAFNGSFILYYLGGDVDYSYVITTPTWERTGSEDAAVLQHQQGISVSVDNDQLAHDITYTAVLPYLGYLRTEMFLFTDKLWDTASHAGISLNISFPDGEEIFFNISHWEVSVGYSQQFNTTVQIKNSTRDIVLSYYGNHGDVDEYLALAKIMYWRTQEDNLGIMFWGDYEGENLWTGGTQWDAQAGHWKNVQGENETIWISDFVVYDFSEVQVELRYYISLTAATDDTSIEYQYNYFEYEYWMPTGVVEPHFSSVYWGGRGAIQLPNGTKIYTFPYDYGDPSEPPPPPPGPFDPILRIFENIGNIFAPIFENIGAMIGGAFAGLGEGIVNGILFAVNLLVGAFEAILNAIDPNNTAGTSFVAFIGSAFGLLGGLGNLVLAFFGFLGSIAGYIAIGLTWAQTYLFTTDMALLIGGILIILPLFALMGHNIMNKGTGYEGVIAWLLVYAGLFIMIIGLGWRLVMGIINTVANFIPLT